MIRLKNINHTPKVTPVSETYTLSLLDGTTIDKDSQISQLTFGNYDNISNAEVTADDLTFGSGGSITFTGNSAVYQGQTGYSWAPSPTNQNNQVGVTTDYLAATNGNDLTMTFGGPQIFFGILWGSVSDGNTLTFMNGGTVVAVINSSTLTTDYGASDQGNYFVSINIPGGYTSVVASSGSGGFEFTDVSYADQVISDSDLTSGSGVHQVTPFDTANDAYLCFLEGTMIAVPDGSIAVETLAPGALVMTAAGNAEPVRWIGKRSVHSRFADPLRAYPVRITADALADGVPARDLLVTDAHALLVDDILIQAGALVNGHSVRRETHMPEIFTYYHVELASHDLILAENAPAETFVDNADRAHFDNWDTHPDHGTITEMDLPRAKSTRQLPMAMRRQLGLNKFAVA